MKTPPTEICISIDTEFSINGAFSHPDDRKPLGEARVHCPLDGRDHGLGFILATLNAHGLKATFFVETANIAYFGDRPMGRVVETLLAAGQDVQLHLHPCWQLFSKPGWRDLVRAGPPCDRCADLPAERLAELIGQGIEVFERWGAPRPLVLRTGNLSAGRNAYQAMAACGLPLGSNVGAGYAPPADPTLMLMGGLNRIGQVIEVPVLTYAQLRFGRWSKMRMLAITASSWQEIKALLLARRTRLSPVVIITHPFEFIKSPSRAGDRPNRVNQRRLRDLCEFIAQHPDAFVAATFGSDGPAWLEREASTAPVLRAPLAAVLGRVVTNALNDRISFL